MVLPVASALGTGYSYSMLFCIYCAFIPFYVQTWEEFYREDFVLPIVNGPSEGLLLTMLVCVISFFQGSVWWWTENVSRPIIKRSTFVLLSIASPGLSGHSSSISAFCSRETRPLSHLLRCRRAWCHSDLPHAVVGSAGHCAPQGSRLVASPHDVVAVYCLYCQQLGVDYA